MLFSIHLPISYEFDGIHYCRGKSASTNTYGDRAPFWFGGGRRAREERIEAMHTRGLPSFGPHGCVKPYCCFVVCIVFLFGSAECYSTLRQLIRLSVSGLLPPPPHVAHGASFYMRKGLPTGGNVGGRKTGKRCVGYSCLHSAIIPNSDGRGQGH